MSLDTQKLKEALVKLANDEEVRVRVRQSFMGAVAVGLTTFVTGIFGGLPGIGSGLVGNVPRAPRRDHSIRLLSEVIDNDLSEEQWNLLQRYIVDAVEDMDGVTMENVIQSMETNSKVQKVVLDAVKRFVCDTMDMTIVDE